MARRKTDPSAEPGGDTFEASLSKLEAIVQAMENQELALEDLVKHYEEGSTLLRKCDAFLRSARERIELITLQASSDGDAEATEESHTPSPARSEDTDDDDIRLF